ncbi:putative ATP-dependent RNA helicase [Thelohanellus kitauei]|uniref:ATP-dependent RNA helicase n=1 Tax=Thelohanellus kitauei TaxID=669202 RepID=A0A0C2JWC6_THEKT|nr:putative ATP-dependent RNA helicase [Thelohanellus kitauei]
MLINCHSDPPKKESTSKPKPIDRFPLNDDRRTRSLKYFGSDPSTGLVTEMLSADKNIAAKNVSMMKSVKLDQFDQISERMKNSLTKVLELDFLSWIQENSIPPIKSGRHTLIKSPSGTGKTLSYAIPIVDILYQGPQQITRSDGIHVLIIVPTKELAKQTCTVFSQVLKNFNWIQIGAVYGEDKRKSEKSRLRKGINILVCTPGRIHDHLLNTYSLKLNNLKILVIDEADMLLDLGYENKIHQIISELRQRCEILDFKKVQTILLSATLDQRVSKLSFGLLANPVFVDASPSEKVALAHELLSCNSQLSQTVVVVPTKWRFVALIWFLHKILSQDKISKVILFVANIYSVKFFTSALREMFDCYHKFFNKLKVEFFELHGSMEIKERMKIFSGFSQTVTGLLVTTDVAARGLDFKNVSWVVQYDPARCPVDYVHRVGRTARAGKEGSSALFLSPHEVGYLEILIESGMKVEQQYDLPQLSSGWLKQKFGQDSKLKKHAIEDEGSSVHNTLKTLVEGSPDLMHLASKCFTACVKSYASYPKNLKKFFNPRVLHIGHLANSLGLEQAPKNISRTLKDGAAAQILDRKRKMSSRNAPISMNIGKKIVNKVKATPRAISTSEYTSKLMNGPTTKKSKF